MSEPYEFVFSMKTKKKVSIDEVAHEHAESCKRFSYESADYSYRAGADWGFAEGERSGYEKAIEVLRELTPEQLGQTAGTPSLQERYAPYFVAYLESQREEKEQDEA